jgi:hypothetical protein
MARFLAFSLCLIGCGNVPADQGASSDMSPTPSGPADTSGATGGSTGSTNGGTTGIGITTGSSGGTTGSNATTGSSGGTTGSTAGSTGGTGIGPSGGSVTLLHFGMTGDTRPPACEDTANYPTGVINAIADQFESLGLQFALDLGDHMYVCNNSLSTANTQMGMYMQAAQRFKGTWFMTMGNHECSGTPCLPGSSNANYVSYMNALAPISKLPYYSFDIQTSLGLATFVIIADNAWSTAQSSWLQQTLTTADTRARYTIVARHHPEGDTSVTTNADSVQIIRQHKFSLFLTGHSHEYKHMTTDNGRDIVLGTGGAPLIAGGAFHGYALVDQQGDGNLKVTVFDVSNVQQDSWTVPPNH